MTMWQEPIFNRTLSDVDALKSLARRIASTGWDNISQEDKIKWLLGNPVHLLASDSTFKTSDGLYLVVGDGKILGALNATDLNRIQNNVRYIKEFLETISIFVTIDDSNPRWETGDYILLSNIDKIISNINLLINSNVVFSNIQNIIPSNPVNFTKINEIEKALFDMYSLI